MASRAFFALFRADRRLKEAGTERRQDLDHVLNQVILHFTGIYHHNGSDNKRMSLGRWPFRPGPISEMALVTAQPCWLA